MLHCSLFCCIFISGRRSLVVSFGLLDVWRWVGAVEGTAVHPHRSVLSARDGQLCLHGSPFSNVWLIFVNLYFIFVSVLMF